MSRGIREILNDMERTAMDNELPGWAKERIRTWVEELERKIVLQER